jgi:hypothetical protein
MAATPPKTPPAGRGRGRNRVPAGPSYAHPPLPHQARTELTGASGTSPGSSATATPAAAAGGGGGGGGRAASARGAKPAAGARRGTCRPPLLVTRGPRRLTHTHTYTHTLTDTCTGPAPAPASVPAAGAGRGRAKAVRPASSAGPAAAPKPASKPLQRTDTPSRSTTGTYVAAYRPGHPMPPPRSPHISARAHVCVCV